MLVYFRNFQNKLDPDDGRLISSGDELGNLLDRKRAISPFTAEFSGVNDFELIVGLGGAYGCIQFNRIDGNAPYLMALSRQPPMRRGCLEFLCGGTPTPTAARYILKFDELKPVILDFAKTGGRSETVIWRELEPRACLEDVERPLES